MFPLIALALPLASCGLFSPSPDFAQVSFSGFREGTEQQRLFFKEVEWWLGESRLERDDGEPLTLVRETLNRNFCFFVPEARSSTGRGFSIRLKADRVQSFITLRLDANDRFMLPGPNTVKEWDYIGRQIEVGERCP